MQSSPDVMLKTNCCPCCRNQLRYVSIGGHNKCTLCGYSCKHLKDPDAQLRYESKFARNDVPDKYLQKKLVARMDYLEPLLASNLRIAEIGCAEGLLGERIRQSTRCTHYWGVEPSLDSEAASKRLDHVVSCSTQLLNQCGNNYFDLILAFHVLEHIKDIKTEAQIWGKLLKPDGIIVVEVPNESGNPIVAYDRNPEHLHSFTPAALSSLMRSHGLDTLSITCGHYESPAYNDSIRLILRPMISDQAKERAFIDSVISLTGKPFSILGIGGDFNSYLMPIFDHLPILSLVDNNISMHGLEVCGMKVGPYDERLHNDTLMLVSSIRYEDEIISMLSERGHSVANIIKLSSILNS
jgi:SAM-dependent methyltransferase